MKKNGFTFIEILGVLTLLSILSLIIIISVNKSLKDSKETLYNEQIENIKNAASMWRTDNIELIPNDDYYIVSLQQLQNEGYIKEDIINPKTSQPFDNITLGVGLNSVQIDTIDNLLKNKGYTKLDYIKTTGTQYINLDYAAKINTEIRLDIELIENENIASISSSGFANIIGRDKVTDSNAFAINFGHGLGEFTQLYYWVDKTNASGASTTYRKKYNQVTSRSTMTVKSESAVFQNETFEIATKTGNNADNIVLLGSYNATENQIKGFNKYDAKVYSFKIYEGDTLIRDMVPYLKDNVAGLYDLVNNKFYTSDGAESFEYGELE